MYRGFPLDLLSTLRCPRDAAALMLRHAGPPASHVITGELQCIHCDRRYTIDQGIVRFLDPKSLDGMAASERLIHDYKAERYDSSSERSAWSEMEIVPTLKALQPLDDKRVLELGCGTGRHTVRIIEHDASIVAVDFSLMALTQLASRIQAAWNLGLVHADCAEFEVEPGVFDAVLVTLLSNLPTTEQRAKALRLAAKAVKAAGKVVMTARYYNLSMSSGREITSSRDSEHGHYRHFFRPRELIEEAAPHFGEVKVRPIQIPIPFASRLPILPRARTIAERLPLLNRFGERLLAVARKPKSNR